MKIISRKSLMLRMLTALMAVCMIVLMLPVGMTAYAASYDLWVGGTRVTSSNASSLLSGKASYNASTDTLTINGATIKKGYKVYDTDAAAAIYSADDLNIVLKGSSTVSVTGYAIAVDGNLNISGTGTLTATTKGDLYSGIYSGGSIKISGGTLKITTTGATSNGIWAYKNLGISGGTVNVTATGAGSYGINTYGELSVSGGTVTAEGKGNNAFGLAVKGTATVTGGSLTASSDGRESFALVASNGLSVSGSYITANAAGSYSTGIYAPTFALTDGSVSAYGSESGIYLDASSLKLSAKANYREGASAPGSSVTALTNLAGSNGGLQTKPFVQISTGREVVRLGGSNRYETARLITDYGWDKAENVVLAYGGNFADALSGVPLAYALNAPILLVDGKTIDDATMKQLSALGTKNVYLLGGEGVITNSCKTQLNKAGYTVERVAGANRSGTAVAIAKKLAEVTGKPITNVFFAYGYNYPDALAASSVAALTSTPILYAPNKGTLDAETKAYIESLSLSGATALGGEYVISAEAFDEIKTVVPSAKRLFGADRYETAIKIIKKYASKFTGEGIAVATGMNYPDALSGAAFAAKEKIAVLLVPMAYATTTQQNSLKSVIDAETTPIYVFGATGAVPDEVVQGLIK